MIEGMHFSEIGPYTILRLLACMGGGIGHLCRIGYVYISWLTYGILDYSTSRFSRDRPRFADNLDVIKFLCKDLWTILFRKQIDNLKTNHRVRQRGLLDPRDNGTSLCGFES